MLLGALDLSQTPSPFLYRMSLNQPFYHPHPTTFLHAASSKKLSAAETNYKFGVNQRRADEAERERQLAEKQREEGAKEWREYEAWKLRLEAAFPHIDAITA